MKQTCPLPFGLSFLWAKGYSTYHPNEVTIFSNVLGLQCLCAKKIDKMAEYQLVIATAISRLSSLSKGFLSPKMVWRKDEQWQHHLEIWRKEALGMNLFLSCFNGSLLGLGKIILLEDLTFLVDEMTQARFSIICHF